MALINNLFPYKLHLHILQLEEYQVTRFLKWLLNNYFKRTVENKKKLDWTKKARILFKTAIALNFFILFLLIKKLGFMGIPLAILLATQSYIFLSFAVLLRLPLEKFNRYRTKINIRNYILRLKQNKLKVIGITGSYGKTSTKEFLYHILKTKYSVLKTPESYNVLFGIKNVIDLELDNSYEFFICEMGAYTIGEIAEICFMVPPDHAILTGINEQHLERFGSIQNTIKAKFELIQATSPKGSIVLNFDNNNVKNNVKEYSNNFTAYGFTQNNFSIKDITVTEDGSEFNLIIDGKTYKANTPLIGNANLQNIIGAATLAYKLGVEPNDIVKSLETLKPVQHRLEIKKIKSTLLIDDAYSSNVTGFKEALNLLHSFPNRKKVLATPGIVELGNKTKEIHIELGQLIDNSCDHILLVGKNERTTAIAEGVTNKDKIVYLNSINELHATLEKLNIPNPIVLLENDLPDNY